MQVVRTVLITLLAIGVVIVCAGYLALRHGLAADRTPGPIETAVARRLVVLSIPRSMRSATNPRAADPQAWRGGERHFIEHCAVCHGTDGRGSAPLASTMYPPVPDLTSPELQQFSDGALFAVIQNGVSWTGMPAFRSEHTSDEIWQLVSFVRHLPEVKPADRRQTRGGEHETGADGRTIHIDGTSFAPSEATVRVGDTISWINNDPFPHNVTAVDGNFKSGDLEPDQRWQYRPTKPGRVQYVCTLHPGMTGTLVVEP